jgi:hypothetical protein
MESLSIYVNDIEWRKLSSKYGSERFQAKKHEGFFFLEEEEGKSGIIFEWFMIINHRIAKKLIFQKCYWMKLECLRLWFR